MDRMIRSEVAAMFSKSHQTITRWIETKGFPEPDRSGMPHLWRTSEVVAWAKRTKTPYLPQFVGE